jgi:hypothetical protein
VGSPWRRQTAHLQSVVAGVAGGIVVGLELLEAIHMATVKQTVQSAMLQAARCQTVAKTQLSRVWVKVGDVATNVAGDWRGRVTSTSSRRRVGSYLLNVSGVLVVAVFDSGVSTCLALALGMGLGLGAIALVTTAVAAAALVAVSSTSSASTTPMRAAATGVAAVGVVVPRAARAILLGVEGWGLAGRTVQTGDLGGGVAAARAAGVVVRSVAGLKHACDDVADVKRVDVGHQLLADKVRRKPIEGGQECVNH